MNERQQIEQAIAALEAQRATLGDPVVDMALTPLRGRLAELQEQDRRSAPRLKYITVLFADIDSTRMGQSLDPEDTHAIMDGALARSGKIVEVHGGRVLRFMGDGLSAAFGTDTSREDDPERAVRAEPVLLADAKRYAQEVGTSATMCRQTAISLRLGKCGRGGKDRTKWRSDRPSSSSYSRWETEKRRAASPPTSELLVDYQFPRTASHVVQFIESQFIHNASPLGK